MNVMFFMNATRVHCCYERRPSGVPPLAPGARATFGGGGHLPAVVGAGAREVGRFWSSVRSFPSRVWAAAGVFGPAPARVAAIGVGGWLLFGGARSVVSEN